MKKIRTGRSLRTYLYNTDGQVNLWFASDLGPYIFFQATAPTSRRVRIVRII